jgi:hypothetical protein
MSRILITGMTSPQASRSLNKRSLSFAGLLELVLRDKGHDVILCEPDVTWTRQDLDTYDQILVGIGPILSLSANNVYGALSVLDVMKDSEKLMYFIDAPQPTQIGSSLRSLVSNPEQLTKNFYAYRKGYQHALNSENTKRFMAVADRLLGEPWPTTIYPSLPWRSAASVAAYLPSTAANSLRGINLDSYLVDKKDLAYSERVNRWVADSLTTPWYRKTILTINYPVKPVKWHKGFTDEDVSLNMAQSIGTLITPYRDGTWWTPRLMQSLNVDTPVITDWKEAGSVGSSWSVLAATVEDMDPAARRALARSQANEYISSIPNKETAANTLNGIIAGNNVTTEVTA